MRRGIILCGLAPGLVLVLTVVLVNVVIALRSDPSAYAEADQYFTSMSKHFSSQEAPDH